MGPAMAKNYTTAVGHGLMNVCPRAYQVHIPYLGAAREATAVYIRKTTALA